MVGGVGEDDDVGVRRKVGQRRGGALGGLDVLDVSQEELVEERPPGGDIQVFAIARLEYVLEQGEAVDSHLESSNAQEPLEPMHEHGQDFIDVHEQQRTTRM